MRIKREYTIQRQGKTMALYAGLLDEAHAQGLRAVTTTLIQVPSDLNGHVAIVTATVETARGTFSGIGDASPDNVSRAMVTATIRLAETRAKARAMRDAINVSEALVDDPSDDGPDDEPAPRRSVDRTTGEIREPAPATPRPTLEQRAAGAAQYLADHADEAALTGYDVVALPEDATPEAVIAEATRMHAHLANAPRMLK